MAKALFPQSRVRRRYVPNTKSLDPERLYKSALTNNGGCWAWLCKVPKWRQLWTRRMLGVAVWSAWVTSAINMEDAVPSVSRVLIQNSKLSKKLPIYYSKKLCSFWIIFRIVKLSSLCTSDGYIECIKDRLNQFSIHQV